MNNLENLGREAGGVDKEHRDFFKKLRPLTHSDNAPETSNVVDNAEPPKTKITEITKRIGEWAKTEILPGQTFRINDAYQVVNAREQEEKKAVSNALAYLVRTKILTRPPDSKYGYYKRVDDVLLFVDYKKASEKSIGVQLPLNLDKHIVLYPSDLVVIAGESGSGKTAIALDFFKENQNQHECLYISSELTGGKLKQRLLLHEDISLDEWNFKMIQRPRDFATAINPDALNVIDFILVTEDFWKVGTILREIHEKMIGGKGICIALLQKSEGKEFARGGDITKDLASFYISLSNGSSNTPNKLKVKKVRDWKGVSSPLEKVMPFKLVNGWKLIPQSETLEYEETLETIDRGKKW